MKRLLRLQNRGLMLPIVLGLADGIMTSLTLTSGLLANSGRPVTFNLALRIAIGAFASGAFVFFVARYSDVRRQLIRAEQQLSLTARGKFAAGKLGNSALRESLVSSAMSSAASFCGALVPLLLAALVPSHRTTSFIASLSMLALLGAGLARLVHGISVRWIAGMILGGTALAILGAYLKIVG